MRRIYLKFILLGSFISVVIIIFVFNHYDKKNVSIAPPEVKKSTFISERQRAIENQEMFFSPQSPWIKEVYTVKSGDSLYRISRLFGITVQLLKQVNRLNSDTITPGMELGVPEPNFRINIDLPNNQLFLHSNDDIIAIYNVGVGKDNSTPIGEFTIVNKVIDPVWYRIGAVIPTDSPDNILGSRWLGLSIEGYGIHGTTEPQSIGKEVSLGCIRMQNKDVEQLFDWVMIETPVRIFSRE